MERISDISDARLDVYARLTDLELRNRLEAERGIFIAESEKVIRRAIDASYQPISLVVPEHRLERSAALIGLFEGYQGVDIFVVPKGELEKLAGYEVTRGVLAAFHRKPLPAVRDLLVGAHRVAVLEGITNHANIGSIFRNAAALGIDAVLVSPDCSDPLYRRAVRVSMGAVFKVPWVHLNNNEGNWLSETVNSLHDFGFECVALALSDNSISIEDPSLKACPKLAMFFGTEGDGLARSTIDACDHVVKIPMQNGVDSLNVAASSALAFWELRTHVL